jgi:hypothetical protein
VFSDLNFDQPHHRLGISHFFAGKDFYKMIAVWGDFTKMQDIRDFISKEWKQEPNTHSGLQNAIADLSRSWVESNENGNV